MNLNQTLSSIPLYLSYFLKVVDEHSIQAPYAYKFFNKLTKSIRSTDAIDEIEHERIALLQDKSVIAGEDYGAGSKLKDAKSISSIARHGISSRKSCMMLHEVAKLCKAETCIELGTSLGIASAYIANANTVKQIYSFEGNETLVRKAQELFDNLELNKVQIIRGNIDTELPNFLKKIETVDLAIVDANHTKNALLHYYQLLKPKMHTKAIMFIDDIRWSNEMYAGWRDLIGREEVSLSMEFLNNGILFFEKGLSKQHYVLSI